MEYLDKVLGVKVTYEDVAFKHLPNFTATRYRLQTVSMNEQKAIFLYPKTELEQIEILPSAQMLLLHFIYGGARELSTRLEEMGLLHIKKVGVQRIMQSEDSPKILFQKAGDKLLNSIKRTVYIPKEFVGTDLLKSGYSALAECSMLNTPNVRYYAAERISQWKDVMTNSLQDSQVQVVVEMWRYNPRKLSTRNVIDELSLALREDADEVLSSFLAGVAAGAVYLSQYANGITAILVP